MVTIFTFPPHHERGQRCGSASSLMCMPARHGIDIYELCASGSKFDSAPLPGEAAVPRSKRAEVPGAARRWLGSATGATRTLQPRRHAHSWRREAYGAAPHHPPDLGPARHRAAEMSTIAAASRRGTSWRSDRESGISQAYALNIAAFVIPSNMRHHHRRFSTGACAAAELSLCSGDS